MNGVECMRKLKEIMPTTQSGDADRVKTRKIFSIRSLLVLRDICSNVPRVPRFSKHCVTCRMVVRRCPPTSPAKSCNPSNPPKRRTSRTDRRTFSPRTRSAARPAEPRLHAKRFPTNSASASRRSAPTSAGFTKNSTSAPALRPSPRHCAANKPAKSTALCHFVPSGTLVPHNGDCWQKRTCCNMAALLDANLQVIVCDVRRKTANAAENNFELSD